MKIFDKNWIKKLGICRKAEVEAVEGKDSR